MPRLKNRGLVAARYGQVDQTKSAYLINELGEPVVCTNRTIATIIFVANGLQRYYKIAMNAIFLYFFVLKS
jgi:hypothetical protein